MLRSFIFSILFSLLNLTFAQRLQTPLEASGFTKLTTHSEILEFIRKLPATSTKIEVEFIAKSVEGKEIPVVKFSEGEFGKNGNKLKVLLFAQQHGNEPSGKEGALMLISKLASGELNYILEKIDLAVIPQMNPDGGDKNLRRNGNRADLNRDHLILMQPENQGLHNFFNKYLFEMSMDVHEYSPYSQSWAKYGYRKNSDVTLGTLTNCNISPEIRDFSNTTYILFIKDYITSAGYSFAEYTPGGPPEIEYIRHSTYDINDGRQGFGSLGTLSFIQEGINGVDSIHMIERRSKSQLAGMIGYLEFAYKNAPQIKKMVKEERARLTAGKPQKIAVQMIHANDGRKLKMPLLSLTTNNDTVVEVSDYRPLVKPVFEVTKPLGYLIPEKNTDLMDWVKKHNILINTFSPSGGEIIEQYTFTAIDSTDFEGDVVINPSYSIKAVSADKLKGGYYFLPTNQLTGNIIVQALEPKSHIGLSTYKPFEYLIVKGANYPILRLISR